MKNPFKKKEIANAWGESVEDAVSRPFRRFFRIFCLVAALLVLGGAGVVSWQRAHSLSAKLEAMESDVSRMLADALDAQNAGELPERVDRGLSLCSAWRKRFRSADPGPDRKLADKLFRLNDLEETSLPRWRRILVVQEGGPWDMPLEERRKLVRREMLAEQEKWPEPPPPPLKIVLSDGIGKFSDGAVVGISWPWESGRRAFFAWTVENARTAPASWKLRYAFFPWRLGNFSFAWILGFGALAAATGYFLCWFGMKSNSAFLSFFGLVYFLYMVVFVVCLMFLVAGVMK